MRRRSTWVVRYLLGIKPCGQVHVYHSDRLGSVRWLTDERQNIMVSYVYEGFGKIIGQNGGGGGSYQFCGLWGYRNDLDAGLLHVGARYYEPETGRFVQRDSLFGSISDPQSLNQYSYCQGDPINFIDPSGHCRIRYVRAIVTAYCDCKRCSGKWGNRTASGGRTHHGCVAADTRYYPFGTPVIIPGYGHGMVEDRGGAIKGPDRFDIWFPTHEEALRWGRRELTVIIIEPCRDFIRKEFHRCL